MTKKNLVSKRKPDGSRVRKSLLASLFDLLQTSSASSGVGRRRASRFESLEDRRVLADVNFSIPTDGTPNLVELRRSANGTNLEIYLDSNLTDNGGVPNPVLDSTYDYSSVGVINITGSDDADQLKIDNANGLIARTVSFNGGLPTAGSGDSLLLTGNPGSTISRETYLIGATKDAGTWVVDPDGSRGAGASSAGNGDELVVNFTGLEPVASDLPMIDAVMVEVPNPAHPYGVKGVGEVSICPPMAAIANAIENATGVRMAELPMSPPRLLAALEAKG